MNKTIKFFTTSMALLITSIGISTAAATTTQAATTEDISVSEVTPLPHATKIEVGNFTYAITKPIGVQTLSGISPRILINPDHIFHHSDVRVTMSDGTVLLRYNDNGWYVDASQVETNILR